MITGNLQLAVLLVLGVTWVWILGRQLVRRLAIANSRTGDEWSDRSDDHQFLPGLLDRVGERVLVVLAEIGRWARVSWGLWADQSVFVRRRQAMLGFCVAPFLAMLLAIALGGVFVRLLLVTLAFLAGFLLYAAWVGRNELRQQETGVRMRLADVADTDDEDADLPGVGLGLFDVGFYESIPELSATADQNRRVEHSEQSRATRQRSQKPVRRTREPSNARIAGQRAEVSTVERTAPASEKAPGVDEQRSVAFTPPSRSRPARGQRPKGRPIYFEPEVDEAAPDFRAASE